MIIIIVANSGLSSMYTYLVPNFYILLQQCVYKRPVPCYFVKITQSIVNRFYPYSKYEKYFTLDVYTPVDLTSSEAIRGLKHSCNVIKSGYFYGLESLNCIRYDTRCYFNVRSKPDMSELNLPH